MSEVSGASFEERNVHIAVSRASDRLRSKCAQSTVYGHERSLPAGAFIELYDGIAMSSPELMFVEMANVLPLTELLLLGFELCGEYSRDAADPRCGNATFDIAPATTVERIRAFLDQTHWLRGAKSARMALEFIADNAWSPTESVIAALANLPLHQLGYELSPCLMNKRVYTPAELKRTTHVESRVPDILLADTNIGFNYDGGGHLDLESIADTAIELGRNPESQVAQDVLKNAVHRVRNKAIDDIRRNRELAANGYIIFPVTKEDLYEYGALDNVMLQAISAIEQFANRDLSPQRHSIANHTLTEMRQELIWSLLPGDAAIRSARMKRRRNKVDFGQVIGIGVGIGS